MQCSLSAAAAVVRVFVGWWAAWWLVSCLFVLATHHVPYHTSHHRMFFCVFLVPVISPLYGRVCPLPLQQQYHIIPHIIHIYGYSVWCYRCGYPAPPQLRESIERGGEGEGEQVRLRMIPLTTLLLSGIYLLEAIKCQSITAPSTTTGSGDRRTAGPQDHDGRAGCWFFFFSFLSSMTQLKFKFLSKSTKKRVLM